MLTCRFIANLRDADLQESTSMSENDRGSIMHFSPPSARFFDSVAGPLSFAGEKSTDDDDAVRGVPPDIQSESDWCRL